RWCLKFDRLGDFDVDERFFSQEMNWRWARMKRALIIIDYTCDFVADDGALTCGKPAQDLDQRISQLVQSFHQDGDFIVVATDTHIENDPYQPDTQLFPPHNIQATAGIQVFGRTGQTLASLEGSDRIKWMPKRSEERR